MAALVLDEHAAGGLAINNVAIVADFTRLDNTVSAAANIDTYRLNGSTDLPSWAIQAKGSTSIRQWFADAL